MQIRELISELTFQGSQCTQDCSGHKAGYQWSMRHGGVHGNSPYSPSFNKGADIAQTQVSNNKIVRPKVRNEKGRFAPGPGAKRPPKQATRAPQPNQPQMAVPQDGQPN